MANFDIKRILTLSGQQQSSRADGFRAHQARLNESLDLTAKQLEEGIEVVDEGLFTNLRAALGAAMTAGKAGVERITDVAKKVSASVAELYKDAKAKVELKDLIKGLSAAIADFETLEKKAPTIAKRDLEVAKELTLFKQLFQRTIESLVARQAVAESLNQDEVAKRLAKLLTEGSEYEDSAEFTDAFYELNDLVKKLQTYVDKHNARMEDWMATTDNNYSTDAVDAYDNLCTALKALIEASDQLQREIDKADE